jgi:hypothetical protein
MAVLPNQKRAKVKTINFIKAQDKLKSFFLQTKDQANLSNKRKDNPKKTKKQVIFEDFD